MKPFHTPVRRNHIVGPAGVGSIIVTRSSITALMCGLPIWMDKAPTRGADETARREDRERLLSTLELHDRNLEHDLGITRLIAPPVLDDSPHHGITWFIPAVRFPLYEYCTNPNCRLLGTAPAESPSLGRCESCAGKRKSRRQQVPMVLACPEGHLDEIDWIGLTHPQGPCTEPSIKYSAGTNTLSPRLVCAGCGVSMMLDANAPVPCTGRRPWLPGFPAEACAEQMRVVDRTSTQLYYPDVRTQIHIPATGGLRDAVLRWLQDDPTANALSRIPGAEAARAILGRALALFPDLTSESLSAHLTYLASSGDRPPSREEELLALTSGRRGTPTSDGPPVLDAEVIDVHNYDNKYVGATAPIAKVVAVHRLAETRALAGFTRITPPNRVAHSTLGFSRLWGRALGEDLAQNWLPGQRTYGEGILLELNSEFAQTWRLQAREHLPDLLLNDEILTPTFQLAHTLAHLLINAASLQCGYPTASLRDRIYNFEDRTALLIYASEGDVLGTLGGLVELAQPGELERLLDAAYASARWCPLDPVCLNPVHHIKHGAAGACHQCCLLPETSCDWWNSGLDRATLIGRGPLKGFLAT